MRTALHAERVLSRRSAVLPRLPLMALAMLALAGALVGGLVRIGWAVPAAPAVLSGLHGPLLVSGFLGTLIGIERGMALGGVAYLPPLLTALGALALVAVAPGGSGPLLLTAGSAGALAVMAHLFRRTPKIFLGTMTAGVGAWLVGNALWAAGWPVHRVVTWWMGFLVLVIAGERQELTRIVPRPASSRTIFVVAAAVLVAGLVVGTRAADAGMHVTGAGFIALAAWLARHDIARRTIRERGLPRFMAAALLTGYAWLALGGILALRYGAVVAGPHYDALLHTVFVGFVFSMIFAHAPVIFPSVLQRPVAYRPTFWIHLGLLHAGLALRIAGDLWLSVAARRWGGLLNAVVVVIFLANTVAAALAPRRAA